jgi:hypothetical protein
MKVGFYNTHAPGADVTNLVLADRLIRSVRATMPGVEVWQLSDGQSPAIDGTDGILRLPSAPLALLTAVHYAQRDGEWLLVDTDVIVQRDVRAVFDDQSFDVAVASRSGTLVANELEPSHESAKFMERMPHNIGVVFSRCPAFWHEVAQRVAKQNAQAQAWMANQQQACDLIREGKYRSKVLDPGFNWSPRTSDEDVSGHAIVHYKGPVRKPWMLARFHEGVA